MKNDKWSPVEERIAEFFGKTTYKDFREGFGGTRESLTARDFAQAMEAVEHEHGSLVPFVLETKYGSTLTHERELCRGWEKFFDKVDPKAGKETKQFSRFACTLAIRELAGASHSRAAMLQYAWIMCVRREALEAAVWLIGSWLDELAGAGVEAFKKQFKKAA